MITSNLRQLLLKALEPKIALGLTVVFFLLMLVSNGVYKIYSDGYASYHIAASLVQKGTVASSEMPEYFNYRGHILSVREGEFVTVYPPGAAFINLPGMYLANLVKDDSQTIYTDYFMAANGHTLGEGLAFLLTAMACGLLSLVLTYKSLRNMEITPKISVFATFAAFASTYVIWYIFLLPSYTHIYEVLGIAIAIYGFTLWQKNKIDRTLLILGLGIGVAVLARPVLAIIGVFFLGGLLVQKQWKPLMWVILGGIPCALLLGGYNFVSYGSFITSGYDVLRSETFVFTVFNGHKVLFSPYRGFFVFSPLFLLSIWGLVKMLKQAKILSISLLGTFFFIAILYGFWPSWWGGGSFGARFLIFATPIGAVGIGYLLQSMRQKKTIFQFGQQRISEFRLVTIVALVLTIWSINLTVLMRFTPPSEQVRLITNAAGAVQYFEYTSPNFFYSYHWRLLRNASGVGDYLTDLKDSMVGGAPLITIPSGKLRHIVLIKEESEMMKFIRLEPPIAGEQITDQARGYITYDKKVYHFLINNFATSKEFTLSCEQECVSEDVNVELVEVRDAIRLERRLYTAIQLGRGIRIYFENTPNIELQGNPLDFDIHSSDFEL